jgi:prophage tail gpP-like protein
MSYYTTQNGIDLQNVKLNKFLNLNKSKNPLKIEINNKEFSEFNALRISYAIDSGCAAFSFDTIFNASKGLSNDIKPFGNEEIKIYYNNKNIFIGKIEKITSGYSNSGSNINIQGRSNSAILLDTQVDGGHLSNSTLNLLSNKFGYSDLLIAPTEQYSVFDWDSGDNAFDILSKYASQKGYWAIPNFNGKLEFIKIDKLTNANISMQDGNENVLSITASYDTTKRYNEYVGIKKDKKKIINDNSISNRGKKYFRANDIVSDLDQVAKLGRSKSISDSMNFSVILSTWEWEKKLFLPGILIYLTSPMNMIYKQSKFCIKQVDYTYDINGGYITELQLCLPSVFTLENPSLDFFETYYDLSIFEQNEISRFLKIPDNDQIYDKIIGTSK